MDADIVKILLVGDEKCGKTTWISFVAPHPLMKDGLQYLMVLLDIQETQRGRAHESDPAPP